MFAFSLYRDVPQRHGVALNRGVSFRAASALIRAPFTQATCMYVADTFIILISSIFHQSFVRRSITRHPPRSHSKNRWFFLLREVRSAGNLGSYRITFITSRRAAMTLYLGKYRNVEISGTSPEQSADFYAFAESLKTRERFKVVKMCQMRNEWKFLIYSFIYYNGKTH